MFKHLALFSVIVTLLAGCTGAPLSRAYVISGEEDGSSPLVTDKEGKQALPSDGES